MSKNSKVIRSGDRVIVRKPLQFIRCGYPKTPKDYIEQATLAVTLIEQQFLPKTERNVLLKPVNKRFPTYVRERLIDKFAWAFCVEEGFGGPERKIYTKENPALLNIECTVESVRSVMTGRYYPPRTWTSYNYLETDWEPGGLANQKVHRIATIYPDRGPHMYLIGEYPEIELIHLEKIPNGE